MAMKTFTKNRSAIGGAGADIDLSSGGSDIRAALLKAGYTPDYSSTGHQYLSSVTSYIIGRTGALTHDYLLGVFTHDDDEFISVPAGDDGVAIIYYKYNASDASAKMIAHFTSGANLPVTPNGTNINLVVDPGANGVFRLHSADES